MTASPARPNRARRRTPIRVTGAVFKHPLATKTQAGTAGAARSYLVYMRLVGVVGMVGEASAGGAGESANVSHKLQPSGRFAASNSL